jgi:hypothetical protein
MYIFLYQDAPTLTLPRYRKGGDGNLQQARAFSSHPPLVAGGGQGGGIRVRSALE